MQGRKRYAAWAWAFPAAMALSACGPASPPADASRSAPLATSHVPGGTEAGPQAMAASAQAPSGARTQVLPGTHPHHHALIIGNAAYPHGDELTAPTRDAALMARALQSRGYEVRLSLDRDYAGMAEDIEAFVLGTPGAQVRVLYFAGHAFEFDSENYLLPVDLPAGIAALDRDQVRMRGLPLHRLLEDLEVEGGTLVGIIDACRILPTRGTAPAAGLADQPAPPGSILAFATAPGQVAMDSLRSFGVDEDHSPYTWFLANHLMAPGTTRWDQVFQATYGIVRTQTGGRQEPWTHYRVSEVPEIGPAAASNAPRGAIAGITLRPERRAAALYWQREGQAIWQLTHDGSVPDATLRRRATEGDHRAAIAAVFRVPEDGRDPAPFLPLLVAPAEAGHALAQEETGNRLWAAKAHDAQGRSARYWWQRACDGGLGSACARLAMASGEAGPEQAQAIAQGFAEMFSGFSQALEADIQEDTQ